MPSIIAVSSQKGGVGKTTTCINLGAEMAVLGHRVLLIDLDPQGHMAEGFGISAFSLDHEMSEVLSGAVRLASIIQEMRPGLFLAPSNIHLAHMEPRLITQMRREDRLKNALTPIQHDYDYILIDCPPSLSILTINALAAADKVLIPMVTEFYAMVGVKLILDTIDDMKRELNPTLEILGIIPTRLDNTTHSKSVVEMVTKELPNIHIFSTIPEAVAVRNATAEAKTVSEFNPSSPAALAYQRLAKELGA